ncbi:DUF5994 family protein [Streptomyces sp. NPDC001744]|uniref:DUF5994 family protein n=1 Tax=Streptomyces sp. NPDC001744 TaxID=3364606 RepID=UPI00369EC49C
MSATIDRSAVRAPVAPLPARLAFTPASPLPGRLDGAWWPRSRDLAAELPALVDALRERWGRITRVAVHPAHWSVVPHKVPVRGHAVHAGWFTEQDPDKIILLSYAVARCDLLVIPPGTEPAAAARLMAAASTPGGHRTAGTLLSDEAAVDRGLRDARRDERSWEDDGGATRPSAPLPAVPPPPAPLPVTGGRMIPLRG